MLVTHILVFWIYQYCGWIYNYPSICLSFQYYPRNILQMIRIRFARLPGDKDTATVVDSIWTIGFTRVALHTLRSRVSPLVAPWPSWSLLSVCTRGSPDWDKTSILWNLLLPFDPVSSGRAVSHPHIMGVRDRTLTPSSRVHVYYFEPYRQTHGQTSYDQLKEFYRCFSIHFKKKNHVIKIVST